MESKKQELFRFKEKGMHLWRTSLEGPHIS